jgi:hypothetical protein
MNSLACYVPPPSGRQGITSPADYFCTGYGKGYNSCTKTYETGLYDPSWYMIKHNVRQPDGAACQ